MWDDDHPFSDSEMIPKTSSSAATSTPNIQRQVEVNFDKYKAFFLLMFQTSFRLSDKALNILLAFVSMFMGLLTKSFPSISFKTFVQLLPSGVAIIHKQ